MMLRLLVLAFMCVNAHPLMSQNTSTACCTIIDLSNEEGTFTIRDIHTGRIVLFKPDALEGAELKVGDTVDATYESKKITRVKGSPKSYELLDPAFADSCCIILKVDSLAKDSMFTITARNNVTGSNFHFKVPKPIATHLNNGEYVFTRPTHGYAMVALQAADTASARLLFGFPMLQN